MKLTDRQLAFATEYIKDFNGTNAAIRAGYRKSGARVTASRLLTKSNIQRKIAEFQQKAQSAAIMTLEEALEVLSQIARGRVADYIDADGRLDLQAIATANPSAIQAIEVTETKGGKGRSVEVTKFRLRDPQGAIERIAKMLGWDKPDKHEHEFTSFADLMKAVSDAENAGHASDG